MKTLRLAPIVLSLCAACGGSPGSTPDAGPTVGPAGGTVTTPDGRATLVVPAGALATAVPLTLTTTGIVPLDPHAVAGTTYLVSPAETTFATPATLRLRYNAANGPSGVDEAELRVAALNNFVWEPIAQGTVEVATRDALAPISGGGTFGVVWPGPQSDCTDPEDHQFDFWLGQWNFSVGSATTGGTNDITAEGRGCLIEEHYRDATGAPGRSTSLFSRLDGKWHQTYIDQRGTRLVLIGTWDGTRMVLYQTPTTRFLWQQTSPTVVRYWQETTSDSGATWSVPFDSNYSRP